MKNITLALLCATITLFSCNKEEELKQTTNYIDTDYYPGSSEKVKEEILEFLSATSTYNSSIAKTDILGLNRTPSEGKWVMEGASNFLTNVNLNLKTDTVIELNIAVENLIANDGNIVMKGSDMVAKFDNLHSNIGNIENSIGKTVKILDYEISNVTTTSTNIVIKTIFGSIGDFIPTSGNYISGLSPVALFELYETDLKEELGSPNTHFYTNIQYNGILPYFHTSDVSDPNYYPEQDPNSPLFDPSLPRCGTNHLGQTDCNVCYDCLWSKKDSNFPPYSTQGTWSGAQANHYYEGTKTVIQNFINNGNYTSWLLDVEISYELFICDCVNDNRWQKVNIVLGKGSSY